MNDIIKRYHPIISETREPENQLEIDVRGWIWDREIRAACWNICELERAFGTLNKLMRESKV